MLPPLNITGCGTKCPLDKFYQLFDDIIPKQDFETECKLWPPSRSDKEFNEMTWKGERAYLTYIKIDGINELIFIFQN